MPLDHYIPQVYLRNFYSSELGPRMYAVRKSDLKEFTPNSKSVCRLDEHNTNELLPDARLIEDFLKLVEPNLNRALDNLKSGNVDQNTVFVVAGLVAYMQTCSPAAMRLGVPVLRAPLEEAAKIIDRRGLLPPSPAELGGKSLTELLQAHEVEVSVSNKAPQAFGISQIISTLSIYGNSCWEILRNRVEDFPFYASDFPIGFERDRHTGIENKVVPLAPDLAIRICPDPSERVLESGISFPRFRYRCKDISRARVGDVNKLVVLSAEEMVFSNRDSDRLRRTVDRYRNYRLVTKIEKTKVGTGTLVRSWREVVQIAATIRAREP